MEGGLASFPAATPGKVLKHVGLHAFEPYGEVPNAWTKEDGPLVRGSTRPAPE